MKNQLLVSDRFHANLIQRVRDSFPADLAQEIINVINIAVGGKQSVDDALAACCDLARQIFNFIAPEIQKAVMRSARCRRAAATRKQKRLQAMTKSQELPPPPCSPILPTRQMRRKREREIAKKLFRSVTGGETRTG